MVYDPKKWGAVKKEAIEGWTVPKSRGGSLAVGTYLQRDSAPPPPPVGYSQHRRYLVVHAGVSHREQSGGIP